MKRLMVALLAAAWLAPPAAHAACSKCKAEQVTVTTAAKDLFGGSDAVGGVDDWYLSNGKVQAIIDDIGTVPTGAGTTVCPTCKADKTSSEAVETGGTLVDLGLNGKNNDQLDEVFNTGGLSLANVFIFRQGDEAQWAPPYVPGAPTPDHNPCVTVGASNPHCPTDDDCAAITVYGIMLGTCKSSSSYLEPCVAGHCSPTTAQTCTTSADCPSTDFCSTRTHPTIPVRTTYKVCGTERAIHLGTEVWNKSGHEQVLPVFDVFLWGGRGLVPFAPDKGQGFTHPVLDLSSTIAVLNALTYAPFFVAPGNTNPADGPMAHGKKAGTVSYGYYLNDSWLDSNGPVSGGSLIHISRLGSLQSPLISAVAIQGLITGSPPVASNRSVVFNRTMVVGLKNDVASVMGDVTSNTDSLLVKSGLSLGTAKGSFKPAPSKEGTVTFIRTGGDDLGSGYATLNSGVVSEVRAKGSFKALLPEGEYHLRAVFAGRPDIAPSAVPPFTVTAGKTVVIPAIALDKAGKLKVEVRDADTKVGMPAKISLSPSPRIRREFASFTYALDTGMCSNDLSTECTTDDSTCGTCFRTCSNVAPQPCATGPTPCPPGFDCASDNYCRQHGCSIDADCGPDYLCRADTVDEQPEGYPGGTAQMQVIYTDSKGKATAEVKPGTYTVSVSRGPKYTIRRFGDVAIAAGETTDLNAVYNAHLPVTLTRVVDTTGYMSADFHIHSGRSFDASPPLKARVNSFASEGVEVMVATDHDVNTDYMPVIKSLKMTPFITSIVGTEVTTAVARPPYMANAWGHINSWPSVYDSMARRGGSVEDEGVSANEIYDRLRGQSTKICIGGTRNGMDCTTKACGKGSVCTDIGEHVVQLNHPRAGGSATTNMGMFGNVGYDPSKDITDCPHYPVLCTKSHCAGGTNDGTSCTSKDDCTGGGLCGCDGDSIPPEGNGCNDILNDMNTIPQHDLCTDPACGSSYKSPNDTRNIDFDIMEIDNAGRASSFGDLRQVRRDWLSLLNQGIEVGSPADKRHPVYVTGVSDSHRLVMELAGYSRTYVGAGNLPNPAKVDVKSFNNTVISGNMTATTGPFISFTAANSSTPATTVNMGAMLNAPVSSVNLNVKVQAAPWVPVDEVRLIKNGCVIACYNKDTTPPFAVSANPLDPYEQTNSDVTRFDATITDDTIASDSYYIVEASQTLPLPPTKPTVDTTVDTVAAGTFMYGVANPIFVDYDGDGKYSGIGLPTGHGEPTTCPPLLPSSGTCSAGAVIASVPSSTMFAQRTLPEPQPNILARVLRTLVGRAVADEPQPSKPQGEERVQRPKREPLRPTTDNLPWARIEFPTPALTPTPGGSAR